MKIQRSKILWRVSVWSAEKLFLCCGWPQACGVWGWMTAVDHPAGRGYSAGDPETRGDRLGWGLGSFGSQVLSPSLIFRCVKTRKFLRSRLFPSQFSWKQRKWTILLGRADRPYGSVLLGLTQSGKKSLWFNAFLQPLWSWFDSLWWMSLFRTLLELNGHGNWGCSQWSG